MKVFDPRTCPLGGRVNFLDATEEEVIDLVRAMVSQLAIMASCLAVPAEQKKTLRADIAKFEAYLNCRHPTQ
jgi:hypothetical protein